MNTSPAITNCVEHITQSLLTEGFSDQEVTLLLMDLDETIHDEIVDEALDKMNEEERAMLDEIDDGTFMAVTGMNRQAVEELYLEKLEEYLAAIPDSVDEITDTLMML